MSDDFHIDVAELEANIAAGAPVIDVRNPHEWVEAHLAGAVLLPMDDIVERIDEVPVDRAVYLICRSGARSGRVAEFLRTKGIDAYNVTGGMLAWIDSGREIVTGDEPG